MSGFIKKTKNKIKSLIFDDNKQISSKINQYEKYRNIMNIDYVKAEYINERSTLASQILDSSNKMKSEVEGYLGMKLEDDENDTSTNIQYIEYVSKYVNNISMIRNYSSVISKYQSFINDSLNDLNITNNIITGLSKIIKEFKDFENDTFREWVNEIEQNKDYDIDKSMKLIEINKNDGSLIVNYSDKLILMTRDVRILLEMNFKIPKEILEKRELADKIFKYAMGFKQIADFYNNLESQIIESQKYMFKNDLSRFEKVINELNKRSVNFENIKILKDSVELLNKSTQSFMATNKMLQNFHHNICDNILKECFKLNIFKN